MLIRPFDWWRRSKSQKYLRIYGFWILVDETLNDEMLTNRSYRWSECLKQLPIDTIIEHVEQNDGLVTNAHIIIPHKLNKKLFNPVKTFFIICNLCNKKWPLNLLKMLHFLLKLPSSKFIYESLVACLIEWELLNIHNDFREGHSKSR